MSFTYEKHPLDLGIQYTPQPLIGDDLFTNNNQYSSVISSGSPSSEGLFVWFCDSAKNFTWSAWLSGVAAQRDEVNYVLGQQLRGWVEVVVQRRLRVT